MARGHRLNTSVVLAAVHGLSGLFRAVSAVEPSLFRLLLLLPPPPPPPPHPPVPVPNKAPRFCGRKAKWCIKPEPVWLFNRTLSYLLLIIFLFLFCFAVVVVFFYIFFYLKIKIEITGRCVCVWWGGGG